ncbi:MAG TPA: helix-turn-helix transcriptional regulator, partial [Aquihabitans sp.]|nr:helix-turn-helix transcriptional regulator [Aquihabitans sp.]
HPLIRAAVVALATAGERRSAHRRLASVHPEDAERRAWHLAEATVEPDAAIAGLLERAARRIRRRGDAVGAIGWLTRAADLHPDARARNRLLVEAAHLGADVAGDLGFASQLLAAADGGGPTADESLVAALTAATVLLCADGDIETGHRLLLAAIERRLDERTTADPLMVQAFDNLRVVCQFGAREHLWAGLDAAALRLPADARDAVRWSVEVGDDPARASAEALRHLDDAVAALAHEGDTTVVARVVPQAFYVDRLPGCRTALRRTVALGRDGTAVVPGMYALVLLAFDRYWAGDWEEASELAAEGAVGSEAIGFGVLSWPAWYCQALLAAGRGEDQAVRSLTDRMVGASAPRGARMVEVFAHHVLALAALGRGDAETAYDHASRVSPPGTFPSRVPVAVWCALDLVDAAVRTGRPEAAAAHAAAMRDAGLAAISPRLALVLGASAAMAADDDRSPALFDDALATPGAHRWPFDVARVELAHGERLRRAKATGDARTHLAAALATFERIGAAPWAQRARTELRAAGRASAPTHRPSLDDLTPQEHEIATLAASGLTNKQIGERLFLSHRTVGAHLYRIFPKLGITSRAALRDALGD